MRSILSGQTSSKACIALPATSCNIYSKLGYNKYTTNLNTKNDSGREEIFLGNCQVLGNQYSSKDISVGEAPVNGP